MVCVCYADCYFVLLLQTTVNISNSKLDFSVFFNWNTNTIPCRSKPVNFLETITFSPFLIYSTNDANRCWHVLFSQMALHCCPVSVVCNATSSQWAHSVVYIDSILPETPIGPDKPTAENNQKQSWIYFCLRLTSVIKCSSSHVSCKFIPKQKINKK